MTRSWTILCGAIAQAGCMDTPASPSYATMSHKLDLARMRSQYRSDLDNPELAPIRGKVDLTEVYGGGKLTCETPGLNGYPTPAEKAALRRWLELRNAFSAGLDALQIEAEASSRPGATPAAWFSAGPLADDRREFSQLISDLTEGRLTYCQFAVRDKSLTFVKVQAMLPMGGQPISNLLPAQPAYTIGGHKLALTSLRDGM